MPPAADAAIVGGGPAGLMAAEVLAVRGVATTVYDHMPSFGRKFLLAGRSGLNLTHSEPLDAFVSRYGSAADRLSPALRGFPPDALRAWAAGLGESTFVGSSGRVFPESFRATPLLRAWLARLSSLGVRFAPRHRWTGWDASGAATFSAADGSMLTAPAGGVVVLALGGASWPRVGSDGSWVPLLTQAGVEVTPLRPANCGFRVTWSDTFRERFAGTPVKNVRFAVAGASDAPGSGSGSWSRGEAVITESGIEGGGVYAVSAALRAAVDDGRSPALLCDVSPDLSVDVLAERMARRRSGESTSTLLRRIGLAPVSVGLLREATSNVLPAGPRDLASLVKATPIAVVEPEPIDRAISTAGGVAWAEVDESYMLRRRPGTFVVGEMLDWEAPTGGYLLQACFSTAVVAGEAAAEWLHGG